MRYRIEIRVKEKYFGTLSDETGIIIPTRYLSEIADLLAKVDKRLFNQWADGCTIFHLTDRQYKKLLNETIS